MKVIVAGGRDFVPSGNAKEYLFNTLKQLKCTEVVSGGCSGADSFGEYVAHMIDIPVKVFKADWSQGKSAGPIRNGRMAIYADALILFPGGRGTYDMRRQAIIHGLKIYEWMEIK
jgi:hypothetical protein